MNGTLPNLKQVINCSISDYLQVQLINEVLDSPYQMGPLLYVVICFNWMFSSNQVFGVGNGDYL